MRNSWLTPGLRKVYVVIVGALLSTVVFSEGVEYKKALFIKTNPQKLWEALVTPEIVSKYYMCDLLKMEQKEGGAVEYGYEQKVLIQGKVKRIKRPELLEHTFAFVPKDKKVPLEFSLVRYDIKPEKGGVRLYLTHVFEKKTQAYRNIEGGWPIILNRLKPLLETGKIPEPKATGRFEPKTIPEQHFLVFKTELKSNLEIGRQAAKHLPKLMKEAKWFGMRVIGPVHHFYYSEEDKRMLEVGVPVKHKVKYKGDYLLVTKPAYTCLSQIHTGKISGIGQSWRNVHLHSYNSDELSSGLGIEVYLSGVTELMSDKTRIELRDVIRDRTKMKGECVVQFVAKDSQAEKIGLRSGDVILQYGNVKIANSKQLIRTIGQSKSGAASQLTVRRGAKTILLKVKAGRLGVGLKDL